MNLRLSILLVVVLLIFGGTFLVIRFTGTDEKVPLNPWLFRVDEGEITHIQVSFQGETVDYNRDSASRRWFIQGDPAIPVYNPKWSGTPLLLSGPRVDRALADTIENPAAFGLDPPLSRIIVTDKGGSSFEFHMGVATPDTENNYVRLVGDPALFTVTATWANVVNRLAFDPPYLRLYQLEDDGADAIEVTSGDQTVSYARVFATGDWIIVGNAEIPVDRNKLGQAPEILSGPRVDQIIAEDIDDEAEFGLDTPNAQVRVRRGNGPVFEFHLGDTTPDGVYRYVRVAGESTVFGMPEDRAQTIMALALDPPYPSDFQPQPSDSG